MTEPTFKKQGFKKCRSATFSIDGFSFTIAESSLEHLLSNQCGSELGKGDGDRALGLEEEGKWECAYPSAGHPQTSQNYWSFSVVHGESLSLMKCPLPSPECRQIGHSTVPTNPPG
ncbi:hypothetical protein MHYP_G00024300 [Metynnis hypsauchen]